MNYLKFGTFNLNSWILIILFYRSKIRRPPTTLNNETTLIVINFINHLYKEQPHLFSSFVRKDVLAFMSQSTLDDNCLLESLKAFTKDGRDLHDLEDDFGQLILKLIRNAAKNNVSPSPSLYCISLIEYITDIVKFNFDQLHTGTKYEIVKAIGFLCPSYGKCVQVARTCLLFYDSCIRYGSFPFEILKNIILSLCRLVSIPWVDESDKLLLQCMENIVSSHYTYSSVLDLLCSIFETEPDESLFVGSIRFLRHLKWSGVKIDNNDDYPNILIFNNLASAVNNCHDLAIEQIVLFLEDMVMIMKTNSETALLSDIEAEVVIEMIIEVYKKIHLLPTSVENKFDFVVTCLKSMFLSHTSSDTTYLKILIESCQDYTKEFTSTLVSLLFENCVWQVSFDNWVEVLLALLNRVFHNIVPLSTPSVVNSGVQENDPDSILVYTKQLIIDNIHTTFSLFSDPAEKEKFFDQVITHIVKQLVMETNPVIIVAISQLSLDIQHSCSSVQVSRLLEQFGGFFVNVKSSKNADSKRKQESIANIDVDASFSSLRSIDNLPSPGYCSKAFASAVAARSCIEVLILTMKISCLYFSGANFVRGYNLLIDLVRPINSTVHCSDKKRILVFLFSFRAAQDYLISFEVSLVTDLVLPIIPEKIKPTQLVTSFGSDQVLDDQTKISVPISSCFDLVLTILTSEPEWSILWFVLNLFPCQLENIYIFSGCLPQIQRLQSTVCDIVSNEGVFPFTMIPENIKKPDIIHTVYKISTRLLAFHKFFNKQQQDELVFSFQYGLQKWPRGVVAKSCLQALTLALFEMPSSIIRILPAIIMKISQTTTSFLGVWNMEFLSVINYLHFSLTL